ncbi:12 kDa extrinsic protein [Seminavis robusta]|uniref:Photosystem II 12 kDa extrinsic protein n=1 Tax=Seminavis robusta TaxID=568900 RepID=A0A9N8H202_9STRA|nr:12 kDa extrinsic protein [Seminavis robusta]|eukprot:Sro53_g031630.1 12 kDa extrinsic protein (157) ;mRNA; r:136325-136929
MMRFLVAVGLFVSASAFVVPQSVRPLETALAMDRREVLAGVAGLIAMPAIANAKPASTWFFDEHIEDVREESQMATGGKLDINAAFVGDYKELVGMFPTAAGKIASHGPYEKVKDIYKIDNLTENDIKLFKKYEASLTVNPPGRAFSERINARVST